MQRVVLVVVIAFGSAVAAYEVTMETQDPGRMGGRGMPQGGSPLVMALDADRDAIISAAELNAAPAALKALDRNSDGVIARDELMPIGFARDGGPGGRGPEGGRGRSAEPGDTPATSPDELVSMLMSFDANKDGQLTKAELPERLQPIFDRSDANKDGKLTPDEIRKSAAAAPQPNARGGREGGERGREGGRGESGPGGPGGVDMLANAIDANHDGTLQAAEIAAAATSLRTLDKNHDGRLTPDEYRQAGRL